MKIQTHCRDKEELCSAAEAASEGSTSSRMTVGVRGGGAYHHLQIFLEGGEAFHQHQLLLLLKLLHVLLEPEEGAFHPQQILQLELLEAKIQAAPLP